jgi:hypothetical protein
VEPQVRELIHVGVILAGTIIIVGALVILGVLIWRTYQGRRHSSISKQRRYEATQIDLFRKRGAAEASTSSGRRHHRSRRRQADNHKIDLFRSEAATVEGNGAGPDGEDNAPAG